MIAGRYPEAAPRLHFCHACFDASDDCQRRWVPNEMRQEIVEVGRITLNVYRQSARIVADKTTKVTGSRERMDVGSKPYSLYGPLYGDHPALDHADTALFEDCAACLSRRSRPAWESSRRCGRQQ